MSVRERQNERASERERERARARESKTVRARERARARERESEREEVRAGEREGEKDERERESESDLGEGRPGNRMLAQAKPVTRLLLRLHIRLPFPSTQTRQGLDARHWSPPVAPFSSSLYFSVGAPILKGLRRGI